jgi:hypothetical protein
MRKLLQAYEHQRHFIGWDAEGTGHMLPCDDNGFVEEGHKYSLDCPCGPEDGKVVTHFRLDPGKCPEYA